MSEVYTLQSRIVGLLKILVPIGIIGGIYYANEQGMFDASNAPKEKEVYKEKWAEEERDTQQSFFEFMAPAEEDEE